MNKIKLFGCALMGAFMAFNLASCEKENFSTKTDVTVTTPSITIPGITLPEGYKPGDAVVSIQPTVNALINGIIENVTAEATIKFNGVEKPYEVLHGQTITEQTITISVSYKAVVDGVENVLEATETINIPQMEAGMVAIITPTIWLSANTDIYYFNQSTEGTPETVKKNIPIENPEYVWYSDQVAKIEFAKGSRVENLEFAEGYENDSKVKAEIEKITKGMSQELNTYILEVGNITVLANSQTIIRISQVKTTTKYEILEGLKWNTSRAVGDVVATFDVVTYSEGNIDEIVTDIHIKGEGHGHAGHGHGHGHSDGNLNAGGSIVDAL